MLKTFLLSSVLREVVRKSPVKFPVRSQGQRPFSKNRHRTKVRTSTRSPLRAEGETEIARTRKPRKPRKPKKLHSAPGPAVIRIKRLNKSPKPMQKKKKM